ncbi:ATP-dependent 6-phosphofructokinase [Aquihabitans sp. McL0605]|uniref:ATP-dependent 6-phosphofructokinase n=1 Tax=Aquihabitans sp. McL0605 TaxID=3415671 RepID=UPI003CF88998
MRIGILTGGGDCPGLNAVLRAAVRTVDVEYGGEVVGFRDGWRGVLNDTWEPLTIDRCRGILPRGGTILGTSRDQPYTQPDGVQQVEEALARHQLDAIVAVGGDGTMGVTNDLHNDGVPVVGVPKTIDNDIASTEMTFGFQTAVEICTYSIDRLHTTAESHDRVLVVEVMGRHVGHIAVWSGIAGGAAVTLVPEEPFDLDDVASRITARHRQGSWATIVVVAEGALPKPGTLTLKEPPVDAYGHQRLGGIANVVAGELEMLTGIETRTTILGHVQRGGTPVAFDRVLGTRFGVAAVDAVADGAFGSMVALQHGAIVRVPVAEGVGHLKMVEPDLLRTAALFEPQHPRTPLPPS